MAALTAWIGAGLVSSAWAEEAPETVESGIKVPAEVGGLPLVAAGTRTLFYMVNTYVVALYMDRRAARRTLAGTPHDGSPLGRRLAYAAVGLDSSVPRTITLVTLRATTTDHMAMSLSAAIDGHLTELAAGSEDGPAGEARKTLREAHTPAVAAFKQLWGAAPLPAGACVEMRMPGDGELQLWIDGSLRGTMRSYPLCVALFLNYADSARSKVPAVARAYETLLDALIR